MIARSRRCCAVSGWTTSVLWDVARIVHEADLADDRFDAPEAVGLDVICRGLSMIRDDPGVLAVTGALFDVSRASPAGTAVGSGPGVRGYLPDTRRFPGGNGGAGVRHGFAAVLLGTSLEDRNVPAWQVGLVLGAIVAGTASCRCWSPGTPTVGRRRWYAGLYLLLGAVVVFALADSVWLLALAALTGARCQPR